MFLLLKKLPTERVSRGSRVSQYEQQVLIMSQCSRRAQWWGAPWLPFIIINSEHLWSFSRRSAGWLAIILKGEWGGNHGITVYGIYCQTIIRPLGPSRSLSLSGQQSAHHQLLIAAETSIENSTEAPPVSYFSGRLFFLSSATKRRPIGYCFDSWRAFDDELLANINSVCFPLNLELHNWSAESKNVLLKIDMTNPLLAAVKVGCDGALLQFKSRGKK